MKKTTKKALRNFKTFVLQFVVVTLVMALIFIIPSTFINGSISFFQLIFYFILDAVLICKAHKSAFPEKR